MSLDLAEVRKSPHLAQWTELLPWAYLVLALAAKELNDRPTLEWPRPLH